MREEHPLTQLARMRFAHSPHYTKAQEQWEMAEFDKWLKAVKADAWDEGAAKGAAYGDTAISLNPMHANPYREQEGA